MAESNLNVENPANKYMHNGNQTLVGVLNPPQKPLIKKLYSYFDGQKLYNDLQYDVWVKSEKAHPKKKGVPTIIKLCTGVLAVGALVLCGTKGIKALIAKFKH